MANRRRRRRRLVATGLLSLAITASTFGVVALTQRNQANEQTRLAEQQAALAAQQTDLAMEQETRAREQEQLAQTEAARAADQERIATARGLAAASVAAIDTDPDLSLLLAISAVETTRDTGGTVLREAEEALHQAVTAGRLVSVTSAELYTRDLVFSPDGGRLYVGGFTESEIATVPGGEIIESMPFDIAAVAVAGHNDEWLVVGGFGGNVTVRDRQSLEEVFSLEGHTDWINDLDVAGGGTLLASISRLRRYGIRVGPGRP